MKTKLMGVVFVVVAMVSAVGKAADIPGGQTQTADNLTANTYQLLLSPAYLISPGGAYLSAKMRYQATEDLGVGFGFGSGELGFNFGAEGIWHLFPQTDYQPSVAVVGGLYFNRFNQANYFAVQAGPVVSEKFKTGFGEVSPYAGLRLTPSFHLGQSDNPFSIKTSVGSQFTIGALDGTQLWTEIGIGVVNSVDEVVIGVSYPFAAL